MFTKFHAGFIPRVEGRRDALWPGRGLEPGVPDQVTHDQLIEFIVMGGLGIHLAVVLDMPRYHASGKLAVDKRRIIQQPANFDQVLCGYEVIY